MKVSCLTATYGRAGVLREAVSCFLAQDYPDAELIILNNHPQPLVVPEPLPRVRIVHEPVYPTLGDCRNRLLELADGEFVRTWDDDDLYLPWAIRQGVEGIGAAPSWKPQFSWHSQRNSVYGLNWNRYEASWTVRADALRRIGYKPNSGGDEHAPLFALPMAEGDVLPSYVYRWGTALWRISGQPEIPIEQRTADWMEANQDTGTPIVPVDLSGYWSDLWIHAASLLNARQREELRHALSRYLSL